MSYLLISSEIRLVVEEEEEEAVVVWWWWVVMMFPRGIGLSYQLISSLLVGSIDDPMKSTDRPTDQIF